MPRTRAVKKKSKNESDELIQKRKLLLEYLNQYDIQVANELRSLDSQTESICNSIKTFSNVQRMGLPKYIREMNFKDYLEQEEGETKSPEVEIIENNSKKDKPNSVLKTRNLTSKFSTKKFLRNETGTPKHENTGVLKVFTPKFDPRNPITPAAGLRSVKPDEKYVMMSVMMSVDGSPLLSDENEVGRPLTDADGKIINITSNMRVPDDLDIDTKNKILLLQKELGK